MKQNQPNSLPKCLSKFEVLRHLVHPSWDSKPFETLDPDTQKIMRIVNCERKIAQWVIDEGERSVDVKGFARYMLNYAKKEPSDPSFKVRDWQVGTLPDAFDQLDFFKELCLLGTRIKSLPRSLQSSNLTSIAITWDYRDPALEHNAQKFIPVVLDSLLPSKSLVLEEIDLRANKLERMPSVIIEFSNLKRLNLAGNRFTRVPEDVWSLRRLETLEFWNNNISSLPEESFVSESLTTLDLSENKISQLPQTFPKQFPRLTTLRIGKNKLEGVFPKCVYGMSQLEELQLNGNKMVDFEDDIEKLSNLRVLRFANNRVCVVQNRVLALPKLERLDLSGNEIYTFQRNIPTSGTLRELNLSNNRLKTWPTTLSENLPELQSLDVSRNKFWENSRFKFEEVMKVILTLPKLRELKLSRSQIGAFKLERERYPALVELDLSYNNIDSLPDNFAQIFPNLRKLDLSGNRFTEIPDCLFFLSKDAQVEMQNMPESFNSDNPSLRNPRSPSFKFHWI